tara:strand:+ start:861 stop:1907 length:1047 start_codon:yes stop_codon:yes gene_type:complete
MTIYIIDLEAVDTRYTKQWKEYLPKQLKTRTNKKIITISGGETPQTTTPGAFLNFGGTNVYKANQMQQIGKLFCDGKVKDGDYFLYTDAWNPTVLQLKYMAELLNLKIKIGGMWHAGSYDPQDFLGRLIGDKPWVRHSEQAMFESFDHNFFASQFHIDLFLKSFDIDKNKIYQVGWPMEYLENTLNSYKNMQKKDMILFPHRMAPEKQPEIFQDLKDSLPKYELIFCQEQTLSKNDYYNMLGEAKMVFSANLQETLGISWYEGALVDTIPMMPDRLSYKEMALDKFKYPSEWTENMDTYKKHKQKLIKSIDDYMENYQKYLPKLKQQTEKLAKNYFSGQKLYGIISNA